MKVLGRFIFWFIFFLMLFNFSSALYFYLNVKSHKISEILSPIPTFFKVNFKNQALAAELWQPKIKNTRFKKLDFLSSKAAISYDLTNNSLIYGENIDAPLPIASITKIMTGIIVLENMALSDKVRISNKAATVGEDSMGLSEGEIHTVEDLLYGLLLPSGNDAAVALAEGSPMGEHDFLYAMNKKAEEIGLTSTRFSNTSGLPGDGAQYSTARDLLVLTRYALKNPFFAKVVSTYQYDISANEDHREYVLYNGTNLLTSYPGVKGVKTGYTAEAGMCLVSYLEHNNHKIIAVLLNSQNRRFEMKGLLDYSLIQIGETPPKHD